MRTKYVETYQAPGGQWLAQTTDPIRTITAPGSSELEALGELCDRIYEVAIEDVGYPEDWP